MGRRGGFYGAEFFGAVTVGGKIEHIRIIVSKSIIYQCMKREGVKINGVNLLLAVVGNWNKFFIPEIFSSAVIS